MTQPGISPKPDSNSATAARKIVSILIIQMGEVGEVLRSLMAMKAIKHLYPEASLHVLSRPGISDPFKRVEWIDSVLETPKFQKGEDPMVKVALWIEKVIHQNYEILANWTASKKYSRMAAISSSLIPAVVKLGDYVNEDFTILSADAWSMYRHAWLDQAIEQDIHYTDMVTTQLLTALQIHFGDPNPEAGLTTVTSKFFFRPGQGVLPKAWLDRPRGLKWIALHGESAPERSAEWVQMVLRRHPDYGVVILGDSTELQIDSNPRVILLGDEIHFDLMVGVLSQCAWLFSGAHPLVDLASLLNLRIFYAAGIESREFGLKWTETGPYGNGHVVLSSKEEWRPEVAYAAWSYFQSEWFHKNSLTLHGHFEHLGLVDALIESQIFKSRIRPSNEGGGVCYEQVAGPVQDFEAWIYRVRGQMARAWFCGWLPGVEQEVAKLNLTPALIKRIRALQDSMNVIEKVVREGRETALRLEACGKKSKVGYLMSLDDRNEIEEAGKKLLEVEALILRVAQVEPELGCLLKWYQQMIHNLSSTTISGMARETADAFDLVTEGLDLISAYTKKTLEQARPKAINPERSPTRVAELDS